MVKEEALINEFNSIKELNEVVHDYIDKYNNKRFHSSISLKNQ